MTSVTVIWQHIVLDIIQNACEDRGGICPSRQCRRQCKIFCQRCKFLHFYSFLCFFLLKLLKLGEIDSVKFLA